VNILNVDQETILACLKAISQKLDTAKLVQTSLPRISAVGLEFDYREKEMELDWDHKPVKYREMAVHLCDMMFRVPDRAKWEETSQSDVSSHSLSANASSSQVSHSVMNELCPAETELNLKFTSSFFMF
jgi:hypothetical protein